MQPSGPSDIRMALPRMRESRRASKERHTFPEGVGSWMSLREDQPTRSLERIHGRLEQPLQGLLVLGLLQDVLWLVQGFLLA
jgi:hypothetical protein